MGSDFLFISVEPFKVEDEVVPVASQEKESALITARGEILGRRMDRRELHKK